jgi:glycosyltransferase involved in cell wall biosynthesis
MTVGKNKILYYSPLYASYSALLSQEIASQDFEVTFATSSNTKYWKSIQSKKDNYLEKNLKSFSFSIKSGSRGKHKEFLSFHLMKMILKNKPDIFITDSNLVFSNFYFICSKLIGGKNISFTTSIINNNSIWGKISNLILKFNDFLIDEYVVPISIKKNKLVQLGINQNKINVIGHGVNTDEFISSNTNNDEKLILYVGRFEKYKGIEFLIESFENLSQKLPKTKLMMIGDGNETKNILKLISKKKIEDKIIYYKNIENSMMPKYFAQADIVVIPSIEPEPFGVVFLEAMASEKAIIAFDVGGGELDIISNGETGILVKLKDTDELSQALYNLSTNDVLRLKIGKSAKTFVKNTFDIKIINNKWKEMLRRIIEN